MVQHSRTLKTLCSVKKAKHKRLHIVQFQLYDIARISKSREAENRLVVARAWEERRMWNDC